MARGLDRARWNVVGPFVDEALDLSRAERVAWLDGLREREPDVADDVAALLADHEQAETEGFLKNSLTPRATLAGQALGAYTLLDPIGRGGMGTVWRAERSDGRYDRLVAVKLLNASLIGHDAEGRFRREGRILARLRHPNIAHLIDAGVSPAGQPYLVLEHVEGEHLLDYCDRRRLGVGDRVRLFRDVLSAVAHAHANLIVHRDLKPSNVLVDHAGTVKLLDFGVAKLQVSDAGGEPPTLTLEGGAWLTPEYAAPEQLTGGDITTATDVFALGVLLYQLLSGCHPLGAFSRESPVDLFREALEREPLRLSAALPVDGSDDVARVRAANRSTTPDGLRRALRGDLETIVAKALKKQPGERYASVVALGDDLWRYLVHAPISARADTLTYRAARFVRRHRLPVALAAVLLAALAAGLAGTLWQARVAARERDAAAHERDIASRERDLAQKQVERAAAINDFNTYLLGFGVPGAQPVPIRELLERAERMAHKRSEHEPALAAELLTNIGDIYSIRDEPDNAKRTLKSAYEMAQKLDDPALRAATTCGWGVSVAMEGDWTGGLGLIETGLASTSNEPRFDTVATNCLLARANVGLRQGSAALVKTSAQEALRRLDQRPEMYPENRATALNLLADGYRLAGDTAEANRTFAQALEQMRLIGREDSLGAITLLNNWAANTSHANQLEALERFRRVVEMLGGPGDPVPIPPLVNYAQQLARLGRHAEARVVLERAKPLAQRHGHTPRLGVVALRLAHACLVLGDLGCARSNLAAAAPALRSAYPAQHYFQGDLLREQALLAEREGRDAEAHRLLLAAQALHERLPDRHPTQIETLLELSRLELRTGAAASAQARAQSALAIAEGFRGGMAQSSWAGLSLLAQGAAQRAQGDPAGARAALERSIAEMVPTLGDEHPAVVEARRLLASSR